jgi:hypothetical protein
MKFKFSILKCLNNNLISITYDELGEYPCVATGTYNNIITYIQNVSYIVIKNIS